MRLCRRQCRPPLTCPRLTPSRNSRAWRIAAGRMPGNIISRAIDLPPDELLDLAAGVVELRFDAGVKVILQGPARADLTSAMAMRLQSGKMTAEILRPEARGFQVQTPKGKVVDLGTEFGVEVTPTRDVEVHVFKGEVVVEQDRPCVRSGRQPRSPRSRSANGKRHGRPAAGRGVRVNRSSAPSTTPTATSTSSPTGASRTTPWARSCPILQATRNPFAARSTRRSTATTCSRTPRQRGPGFPTTCRPIRSCKAVPPIAAAWTTPCRPSRLRRPATSIRARASAMPRRSTFKR